MKFNDKYQPIKMLSTTGNFSKLFEVELLNNKNNKNHYALKLMDKGLETQYNREIEVMKNIKNKYIVELIDNFYDETNGYCIVMELCDGDLRQILNKYKPKGLPLNIINKIFYQLNDAL